MPIRKRADLLLVERGLFDSRAKAQAAIAAGLVVADSVVVSKPSSTISVDAEVRAVPAHPWVSRGGVKLVGALDRLSVEVKDRVCLDVGASTGGFSEVLLSRGARAVYAVDVGNGQLHHSMRDRVGLISFENTDIRAIAATSFAMPPDLVTVDVSFISLKLVLPAALTLATPRMTLIALIKPQFEVAPRHRKRGIVRDPAVHTAVCDDIASFVRTQGLTVRGVFPSAIAGGDGNREFFIGAERG